MDLEEICINAGNWVDSAQNRDYWRALVNASLNLRISLDMELIVFRRLASYSWSLSCAIFLGVFNSIPLLVATLFISFLGLPRLLLPSGFPLIISPN